MRSRLIRLYLLLVSSTALLFCAWMLAQFLHPILLMLGMRDVDSFLGADGVPSSLLIHPGDFFASPAQQLWDLLPLLLVTLVVVVPVLVLHYLALRHLESQEPAARGSVERVIILDLLAIACGLVISVAGTNAAAAWLQLWPGPTFRFYSDAHGFEALAVAYMLAFGVALALLLLERRRTVAPGVQAQRLSWSLLGLAQIALLLQVFNVGSGALQGILEGFAYRTTPDCYVCRESGIHIFYDNSIGQALVALMLFAVATYLVRGDLGDTIGALRTIISLFCSIGLTFFWTIMFIKQLNATPENENLFPPVVAFEYGALIMAYLVLG